MSSRVSEMSSTSTTSINPISAINRSTMVVSMVTTWDETRQPIEDWLLNYESACDVLALGDEEQYLALISGLGFERVSLLTCEAKQLNNLPPVDQRNVAWLTHLVKQRYGKQWNGYDLVKEFMKRRLQPNEPVAKYCADKTDIYFKMIAELQKCKGTRDDGVLLSGLLDGLPGALQTQVKALLANQGTKTQVLVTQVIDTVRGSPVSTPVKKSEKSPAKMEKRNSPKGTLKSPIRCYTCNKEGHKSTECPERKDKKEKEEKKENKSKSEADYRTKLRDRKNPRKRQTLKDDSDEEKSVYTVGKGENLRFVSLFVEGHKTLCLLDTGASTSVMDRMFARKLGVKRKKSNIPSVETPAGNVSVIGGADVLVKVSENSIELPLECHVIENFSFPLLIGSNFLKNCKVIVDYSQERVKIGSEYAKMMDKNGVPFVGSLKDVLACEVNPELSEYDKNEISKILKENNDLFSPVLDFSKVRKNIEHHIPLKDPKPIAEPLRRMPLWKRKKIDELVQEML